MAQTIELSDVIASAFEGALHGIWTAMPGQVESFDAEKQTASIQLTVKNGSVGQSGERVVETIAVLPSVPVIFLGGGGYRTTYPIKRGDTVLVVFASRSIARWMVNGGVVDPGTDHHLDQSDGVALVGLRDFNHLLKNVPTDRMSIGNDDGPTIEINDSNVKIGGNTGTQPTIMGTSYRTAEDAYFAAVNNVLIALMSAIITLSAAVPTLTGTPAQTGAFSTAVSAVAALAAPTSFPAQVTAFNSGSSTYLTDTTEVK